MPAPKWALLKATESVEVNAYSYEVESSIQYIYTLYACVSVDLMIEISSNKFVNPWLQPKSGSNMKSDTVSDLEWSILAVDTQQWHQYCSNHHHTQCPTHHSNRSPLCPHLEHYLQLTAVDQLSMELQSN